jgi:PKHD-type hydroxylase
MWYLQEQIVDETWAFYDTVFTKEECSTIIGYGLSLSPADAIIGVDAVVDNAIRKSKTAFFDHTDTGAEWIHKRCASVVNNINEKFFNFDLKYIETLQFTCYIESGSKYDPHIDTMYKSFGTRKLSFSILLNDPAEFEGGDLQLFTGPTPIIAKRQQGTAILFPSYTLHAVTPITKGTRYSLVGWVVGPRFK